MEESDTEEDLRRLTNLKPIKKKKHRFGLPVWHIPDLCICRFRHKNFSQWVLMLQLHLPFHTNWLKSKVCQQNANSWKTSSSVALQTHWPIMQECLFILCEEHSVRQAWSLRGFVSDVSEKITENRAIFYLWLLMIQFKMFSKRHQNQLSYGVCFITKTGFCSIIPRAE